MRHNHTQKPSNQLDKYDRVYIDIPWCPWLHSIVAEPLKTIYYNTAAGRYGNIDKLFKNVYDMERFCEKYGIELY